MADEKDEEDELNITLETNEAETEISLKVSSSLGRKIEQHELIMTLECYLHELAKAEMQRNEPQNSLH